MTILIIIDGTVYRAKEKWPIEVHELWASENTTWECKNVEHALRCIYGDRFGENNLNRPVLNACFDKVETDIWDDYDSEGFTLDRLTGKEKP